MSHYLEKLIMKQCIADLLAAGYTISVHDGEETILLKSTEGDAIFAAMYTTDEDYLHVFSKAGKPVGWVHFIYGNDGPDVINDYTASLEDALKRTNALADEMLS
jgi:hypothetical protein